MHGLSVSFMIMTSVPANTAQLKGLNAQVIEILELHILILNHFA